MPIRDDQSHGRMANFKFNGKHEVSIIYIINKIICFYFYNRYF